MLYRFEGFELNTDAGEFTRDSRPCDAEPQVLLLLEFFLANANRLITKSEIVDAVWQGRAISDSSISSCVKSLRKLIGDDGRQQRLLRTLNRRGFRFVADVEVAGQLETRPSGTHATNASDAAVPALAILPFENQSPEADQQHIADGIADDLTTAMSKWRIFPVISRFETAAHLQGMSSVRAVAKELGAGHLLKGAVRRGRGLLRVSLQLIDGRTGQTVWSESLDREDRDVLATQDEITRLVAATVTPVLERQEWRRSASKQHDLAPWELNFRGHRLLNKYSRGGNIEAREAFESALKLDPENAQAHIGIAYSHHRDLFWNFVQDRPASIEAMRLSSEQAVVLDPVDAAARIVMAYSMLWLAQFDRAIGEAKQAVKLNPSDSFSHVVLAEAQDMLGRHSAALESATFGINLNEQHHRIHTFYGVPARIELASEDYDAAEGWADRALSQRPNYPQASLYRAAARALADPNAPKSTILSAINGQPVGLAFCYRDADVVARLRDGFLRAGCEKQVIDAQLPQPSSSP